MAFVPLRTAKSIGIKLQTTSYANILVVSVEVGWDTEIKTSVCLCSIVAIVLCVHSHQGDLLKWPFSLTLHSLSFLRSNNGNRIIFILNGGVSISFTKGTEPKVALEVYRGCLDRCYTGAVSTLDP